MNSCQIIGQLQKPAARFDGHQVCLLNPERERERLQPVDYRKQTIEKVLSSIVQMFGQTGRRSLEIHNLIDSLDETFSESAPKYDNTGQR